MGTALLFLIVTGASLVGSLTGLGGGSLILAALMFIYPPGLAIPLHSFTQLSSNGLRASVHFKKVSWKIVAVYALPMVPLAWVGARLFEYINPDVLRIVVGSIILISLIPFKSKNADEPSALIFFLAGAASGFLGVFVGSVGPMVTPLFNRLKIPREGNIATKSAGQFCLQLSKIAAFSGAANVDFVSLRDYVGVLIAGSLLGVGLSIPISKMISDDRFNLMVNILLAAIAVKLLYEGIIHLK